MARPRAEKLKDTFTEETVGALIPKLEGLVALKADKASEWIELNAKMQATKLKTRFPDPRPEAEKRYHSAINALPKINKGLTEALDWGLQEPKNRRAVEMYVGLFYRALLDEFSPYRNRNNANYKEETQRRSEAGERIVINPQPFLERAYMVLESLDDLTPKEWPEVSCAIALATGRRMSEIHSSAVFGLIDEYTLSFRGYLKGKTRMVDEVSIFEHEFIIPTLLPAQLILNGMEWLEMNGKREICNDDSYRAVNSRFGTPLNNHVKGCDWNFMAGQTGARMTYHKFRSFYFRCALKVSNPDHFDVEKLSSQILGDNDPDTIQAYKRFDLVPDAICRL